jgi:hypothetical protein
MPQALPGVSSSSPPAQARAGNGFLRVVSGADLDREDRARVEARIAARQNRLAVPDLGAFIRRRWEMLRNHRNQGNNPLNQRLLRAQSMFEGKYDADKLAQIRQFGGSEVYSRLVAVKCRGATSLLRDVYLGPDRPWDIQPQPDPPVPDEIRQNIMQLIQSEAGNLAQSGAPVTDDQLHTRYFSLMHAAQAAARRNATLQADAASDKVEDILVAGGFYEALNEFLIDLPLFPFAVIKGPTVRMVPKLAWIQGKPSLQNRPQMFWERVNPFDVYWTPGANNIADAEIIERKRLTRADLNDLLGLPGYNEDAIRLALADYANGLREWMDAPDTEQALNEGRENPTMNFSHYIDAIEYHGNVQGRSLLIEGVDPKLIPDPDRDYMVQSWVVGRWTIKTQLNPSPRQRHPYYVTSYEKVPGTIAGHALPDILEDLQEVCNATLRAMVNNMAISSGPQVVINDEMVSPTEAGDQLYPWKRWHVQGDPMGNGRDPITFFAPPSNAQELLAIYQSVTNVADEISAIPRYITGSERLGGAGRTASGLSMMMGNSSKVLQTVASNIDLDVMKPLLTGMYDMIMLTDSSGILTGEEEIRVKGTDVAVQKETERQKQLQFLQITANPIDAPIIGEVGRGRLLRALAQGLGLPDDLVPDDQTLQAQVQAQKQMEAAGQALMGAGAPGAAGQQGPGQAGGPPGGADAANQPGKGPPTSAAGPPNPARQAVGQQQPKTRAAALSDHAPPINLMMQGAGMTNV